MALNFWDLITEFYNMHKDDVLHLGNKLQSNSCSTDPKVLTSLCIIHIKSIGVVKSQNSVHTSQFVENNKYYIFDTSNSKRIMASRCCQYHWKTTT